MGTSGLGQLTCIPASAKVFSFPGAEESMMGKRGGGGAEKGDQLIYQKSWRPHSFVPLHSFTHWRSSTLSSLGSPCPESQLLDPRDAQASSTPASSALGE